MHVYAIRLSNPRPQWPITALTLQTVPRGGGAPAFLAVTVELALTTEVESHTSIHPRQRPTQRRLVAAPLASR